MVELRPMPRDDQQLDLQVAKWEVTMETAGAYPPGVSANTVFQYTTGGCYELALELHKRSGWQLMMECWREEDDESCCPRSWGDDGALGQIGCHGYVMTPDGLKLDVTGLHLPTEPFQRQDDEEEIIPTDWWEVSAEVMAYGADQCMGYVQYAQTKRLATLLLKYAASIAR
jgi:hypothetical protein